MLLEAWGDCKCSRDSNIVAVNGRVDFLKKKLAHQPWGDGVVGDGFPRVLVTSTGAVVGSGTQVAPRQQAPTVVVGGHEQVSRWRARLLCSCFCGLMESAAATPGRPLHPITGGGGCSTTKMHGPTTFNLFPYF